MNKLFKRMTKKEYGMVVLSVLFIVIQVWLDLMIPDYMNDITKQLQSNQVDVNAILEPGIKMIALAIFSLLATVVTGFIAARLASSFATGLRRDLFNRVVEYSTTEIKHFSIASLLTRTINDVSQIQLLVAMGTQVIIKGPIMAIWAMTKIAGKTTDWLLVTALAVVIMTVTIVILLVVAFPKQNQIQKLTDKVNGIIRESLIGVRVVRAYNAEKYEEEKFEEVNTNLTNLNLFVNRVMSIMTPIITFVTNGITLAIYWIGAVTINQTALSERIIIFSDMIIFTSYAMQIIFGFMMMMMIFIFLPQAIVSAKRINEVLEMNTSIVFGQEDETSAQKGEIIFKNVDFAYSNTAEKVLENISFTAHRGETVAIIGSTGSGKSTLANLIPRFYDSISGQILINGKDIKSYSHEALNKIVGYIPQKAVLFSGNVLNNVDFGESNASPLNEQAVSDALALAQASSFIQDKEDGIHSRVAQGGTNFSGGQRQRLAISRALARKSEIIVFDDSFSALDYKTDRILREQLAIQTKDVTKIIVAQRISTIMDADNIIVLDDGKIVGMGKHKELLKNSKVYQEIAYSQLSKEELEYESKI